MLGAKSFYKTSRNMAPRERPKRNASTLATSPPKKQRTAKQVRVKTEMLDTKTDATIGARRSPRISSKVKVSVTKVDRGKENVKRGRKAGSARKIIKKEEDEDEEEEEKEEGMMDVKPLKEESMSDEDDDEDGGLSAYEKKRLENISKNAEFFASLNIFQAKENLAALSPQVSKPKPVRRGLKSQERTREVLPRRAPSLRLQNKSPEGTELPEKWKEPPLYSLYLPQPREHERLPSGPIKMDATNVKKVEKTDAGADFVKSLSKLNKGIKAKVDVDNDDLERFAKRLHKMKMKETSVAKVVPDRIFSVAVHPSVDRTIVAAGDKWGKVGLWDVNSTQGDDGVFLFAPHARPINCLRFTPNDPTKIFSASYDGTVRCGDFTKGVFDEVLVTEEEENVLTSYFDFTSSACNTLLVTHNEGSGYVAQVDTRTSNLSAETVYMVHPKRVRTISVHPTMQHYFVTSSADCTAALWDIRSMKKSGTNHPLAKMPHSKTVSSAFFSPLTGSKILTTSMDDKLSIFETESAKEGKLTGVKRTLWQSHNNHTGRWLTVFRATWHPRREDAFVVGSMAQPRRIEVFSHKGKAIHHFLDENLASVCSINAFHPTRDLIAGGNSSGKLHILMS